MIDGRKEKEQNKDKKDGQLCLDAPLDEINKNGYDAKSSYPSA